MVSSDLCHTREYRACIIMTTCIIAAIMHVKGRVLRVYDCDYRTWFLDDLPVVLDAE